MSYRIFIVDDEIEVASMLQRFLQRRSYIADYCLDGAEAMRMAESQPDLILLDINMPQIDGIEVWGHPGQGLLPHPLPDRQGPRRG